jgi:hypothetical protein
LKYVGFDEEEGSSAGLAEVEGVGSDVAFEVSDCFAVNGTAVCPWLGPAEEALID